MTDDELPDYAVAEPPPVEDEEAPVRLRDVLDLVVDMSLLGMVFGLLLSAESRYAKLLLVPLALFGWRAGKRLLVLVVRVFRS